MIISAVHDASCISEKLVLVARKMKTVSRIGASTV